MSTLTLKGKLVDLTTNPVEEITNVTVKAPAPNSSNVGTITTQPRKVNLSSDGSFSLTVAEGTGWLYIEGPGWSDSIRFVAKGGMTLFEQARLNAGPWALPLPLAENALDQITKALTDSLNALSGATAAKAAVISEGMDWDTIVTEGKWLRQYPNQNDKNEPPSDAAGVLYVGNPRAPKTDMASQVFVGYAGSGIFYRSQGSSGVWSAWVRVDQDERVGNANKLLPSSARREAVVDAGLKRRGYAIGTGGTAAIALRFDHHLDPWGKKILPLLKKYRLPWGQMLNAKNIGTGDDTMPASTVAKNAHDTGGEVWNHSWSHSDTKTDAQADREVTLGLSDLRKSFPSLWIDSFAPPGQPTLGGFEGQDTAEKFWGTDYGQYALAQHCFVRGYFPGAYQPMQGANLIGAPHVTLDSQSVSWITKYIDGVVGTKTASTLMLHPNYLDKSGYLSLSNFESILAHIAKLRDAGKLQVMSVSGILLADDSIPVNRTNMLENSQLNQVNREQKFAVSERVGKDNFGVPHEASAWVKAKADGEVSLSVKVTSASRTVSNDHTLVMKSGQVARLTVPITPPLDTTAQDVTLSGTVEHTGVIYRPI